MKKVVICNNCKTENPFYNLNCNKCNAFLRSKIVNIDLWDTLWKILESPIKTCEQIIQADHKNFVTTILILVGIKIGIGFLTISNALFLFDTEIENSFGFIILVAVCFISSLIIISSLATVVNKLFGLTNRFKDNLALYSYSFLPIVLTLFVLTPIQIALYGTYWFTFNPSPLFIKPTATTVLILIESLFLIWSFFLIIISNYSQSKNIIYSILFGFIEIIFLFLTSYFFLIFFY